ncbi:MAG: hypothetical protein WB554_09960 [Desulfomonilaceae bacterium]
MTAIKALLRGISHDQVAKLYDTARRNLSRWWIDRVITSGIDGLIQRPWLGRLRKINHDKRINILSLFSTRIWRMRIIGREKIPRILDQTT